jgi:hypothetical protein
VRKLSWLQTSSQEENCFSSLRKGRKLKMLDRGKHLDTEKKSSSGSNRDFTRRLSQERSESQHRGEKRNSATSSSQEAGRPKASSSDLVRKLDQLHISKRTDHQRPSGQRPTGTKFSREISRATSSSFPGRDARLQRKYDSLLRTQGRRLRGGGDPDETSEQQDKFKHSDTSPFQSYDKGNISKQQDDTNKQQDDQRAQEIEQALQTWQDYKSNNPDWKQHHEIYKS